MRTSSFSGSQLIGFVINVLPGSFNLKWSELRAFALGQFMFNDGIDAAAARTLVQRNLQLGQNIWFASGDDLNVAVVGVADPAAQAKLRRFPLHKPAEADALHAAFYKVMDTMELQCRRAAIPMQGDRSCKSKEAGPSDPASRFV